MKRTAAWVLLMALLFSGCTNSLFLNYSVSGSNRQSQQIDLDALIFGANYDGSVSDYLQKLNGKKSSSESGKGSWMKSANLALESGGGSRATSGERAFFLGKVEYKEGLGYKVESHEDSDFIYFEVIDFIEDKNMFIYAYQTIVKDAAGESKLESQLMAYQYDTHIYQIIFKQTSDPSENLSQSMFAQKLTKASYRAVYNNIAYENPTYSKVPESSDYFLYFGGKAYYYKWDANATAQNNWYWEDQEAEAPGAGAYVNNGEIDLTNGYMRVYNQVEAEKKKEDPKYKGLYSMTVTDVTAAGSTYKDIYMSLAIEYEKLDDSVYLDDTEDTNTEAIYNANTLNITLKYSIKDLNNANIYAKKKINEWQIIDEETEEYGWVPLEDGSAEQLQNSYTEFVDDDGNRYDMYYCDDNMGAYNIYDTWSSDSVFSSWVPNIKKTDANDVVNEKNLTDVGLFLTAQSTMSSVYSKGPLTTKLGQLTKNVFEQIKNKIETVDASSGSKSNRQTTVKVLPTNLSQVYSYKFDAETGREVYYHFSGEVEWVSGETVRKVSSQKAITTSKDYFIYGYLDDGKYDYDYNVTDYFDGAESGSVHRTLPTDEYQSVIETTYNGENALKLCKPSEIEAPVSWKKKTTDDDLFGELTKQTESDTIIVQDGVSDGSVLNIIYDAYADEDTIYFKMPEKFYECFLIVDLGTETITRAPGGTEDDYEEDKALVSWYKVGTATLTGTEYPIRHTYWEAVTDDDDVEYVGASVVAGSFKAPDIKCEAYQKTTISTHVKYKAKYATEYEIAQVKKFSNYYYSCEVISPSGQYLRGGIGVNSYADAMEYTYLYSFDRGAESEYTTPKMVTNINVAKTVNMYTTNLYIDEESDYLKGHADLANRIFTEIPVSQFISSPNEAPFTVGVKATIGVVEGGIANKDYTVIRPYITSSELATETRTIDNEKVKIFNRIVTKNEAAGYYRSDIYGGLLEVFVTFSYRGKKGEAALSVNVSAVITTPMPLITTQQTENSEDIEEGSTTRLNPLDRVSGYLSDSADKFAPINSKGNGEDSSYSDVLVYSEDAVYSNAGTADTAEISLFADARTNFKLTSYSDGGEFYDEIGGHHIYRMTTEYAFSIFNPLKKNKRNWKISGRRRYEGSFWNWTWDHGILGVGRNDRVYEDDFMKGTYELETIDGKKYYKAEVDADDAANYGYGIITQMIANLLGHNDNGVYSMYSNFDDFIQITPKKEYDGSISSYTVLIATEKTLRSDGYLNAGRVKIATSNTDKTKPFGQFYASEIIFPFTNCSCHSKRKLIYIFANGPYVDYPIVGGKMFNTKLSAYGVNGLRTVNVGHDMAMSYAIGYNSKIQLTPAQTTLISVSKLGDGSYVSGGTSSFSKDSKITHLYVDYDATWDADMCDKKAIRAGMVTDVVKVPLKSGDNYVVAAFGQNGIYFAPYSTVKVEENGKNASVYSLNAEGAFRITAADLTRLESGFSINLDEEETVTAPVDNTVATMTVSVDEPPALGENEMYYYGYALKPDTETEEITFGDIPYTTETTVEFDSVPKNNIYCIFRIKAIRKEVNSGEDGEYVTCEYDKDTLIYLKKYSFKEDWIDGKISIDSESTDKVQYEYACSQLEYGGDIKDSAWKRGEVGETVNLTGITTGKTYYVFSRKRELNVADETTGELKWSEWGEMSFVKKVDVQEASNPYKDAQTSSDYLDTADAELQVEEISDSDDYDYQLDSEALVSCTYEPDSLHFITNNTFFISNPDVGIAQVTIDRKNSTDVITQDMIKLTKVADGCYYSTWKLSSEPNLYMAVGFDDDGSSYMRGDLPYAGVYKIRISGESTVEGNVVRNTLKDIMSNALEEELKSLGKSAVSLTTGVDGIIENVNESYQSYVKIDAYNKVLNNQGLFTGDTIDRLEVTQYWAKASTTLAARVWKDSESTAENATAKVSELSAYINKKLSDSVNDVMDVVNKDSTDEEAIRNAVLSIRAEVTDKNSEFRKKVNTDLQELEEMITTIEALKEISDTSKTTASMAENIASQYTASVTEKTLAIKNRYSGFADQGYNSFGYSLVTLLRYGEKYYESVVSAGGYAGVAQNLSDSELLKELIIGQQLAYSVGVTENGVYKKGFLDVLCDVYGSELNFEPGSTYNRSLSELAETIEHLDHYKIMQQTAQEQVSNLESALTQTSLQQQTKNEIQEELDKAQTQLDAITQAVETYEEKLKQQLAPFSKNMIKENFDFYVDLS